MRPVKQTVFGYPNGNCFAACIASLLELPIEETPSIEGRSFWRVWSAWLAIRGLAYVDVSAGSGVYFPGYSIATGKSPRGGLTEAGRPVLHAVVCENMNLLHDPHPDNTFLDGSPIEYGVLYPLDPVRLIRSDFSTP